jgi:MATE family multidrug resistance protein
VDDTTAAATETENNCTSSPPSSSLNSTTSLEGKEEDATTFLGFFASAFKASPHDPAIFSLALPAVLALAADPLLQVVDTIFVGQTGPDALAALGVNSALFTFSFLVFNFLATATTPLVATAIAAGDGRRAGTVTIQAMLLATVLGTGLTAGLTIGADQALMLMGTDPTATPEMFSLAKDFLLIRALAAPAVLLMTVGNGAFRGLQDMRTPLNITLATNAINFGLDTLLILGLGWGVKGAATATSIAEWIAAIAYLSLLYRRKDQLGGLEIGSAINSTSLSAAAADMAPFLQAGGAVLLRTAMLLGTKTLASATAARLGPTSIASHQVVMQLWLLSSLIIDSLAVAGQSLVAVDKGRGDIARARQVSNRLLQLGIGGGVVLAAGFWVAEPYIPGIFTQDSGVTAATEAILPIAVAMLPINAAVYVFDGILVGASDFKWMAGAMVVAAASAVGLLMGVEPMELGLTGVWGALAVLMTGRLATLVWRYQSPNGPLPPHGSLIASSSLTSNVIPVIPPMQQQCDTRAAAAAKNNINNAAKQKKNKQKNVR